MDVPLEAAALRVPRGDQALARDAQRRGLLVQFPQTDLELFGQPDVVQGQPCLRGQIAKEGLLRWREGIVRGLRHDQVPDGLPLIADRDRPRLGDALRVDARSRPPLGPLEPAGQTYPDGRFDRSDPASGRLGHLRQDPIGRYSVGDPLGEAGDHLVGRGSLAVDQSVREAARAHAHGLEQHRQRSFPLFERLSQYVARRQNEGALRPGKPHVVIAAIIGTAAHYAMMTGLFGFCTNADDAQVSEDFLQLILNGVKAK